MITVIQRVSEASVTIDNAIKGKIDQGLMILLGIEETDGKEDIDWLVRKVLNLRIFDDEESKSRGVCTFSFNESDIVRSEILKFLISRLQKAEKNV